MGFVPLRMQNIRNYILIIVRNPYFLRFSMSVVIFVIGFVVISAMSTKAHSESDVKYKQESIFVGAGLKPSAKNSPPTNPSPIGLHDPISAFGMSYEVDKVTPTPTPVFDPTNDDIWLKLADCESHKNWKSDTGNGYYGGLQFSLGAWASVGGSGKPSDASAEEQISRGKLLQSRRGWGAWGGCGKKLGLL